MKKLLFPMLCALVLAGTLSSCKYFPVDPTDPIDPGDPVDDSSFVLNVLPNTSWKLESYSLLNSRSHAVFIAGMFTLNFSSNEVSGAADCNSFSATYKVSGSHLSFSNLISTQAGCDNSFDFYGALATASSYGVDNDILRIVCDNGTKELVFSRMYTQPVTEKSIVMFDSFETVTFRIDPFRLLDVQKIDDTHLMVTVEYGGGCHDDHDFTLNGSAKFTVGNATDWANVILTHDSKNDVCNAIIVKSYIYDMSPMIKAHAATGSINRLVLKFGQFGNDTEIEF